MRKVLYPGSFDPFTKGHEDVVRQALQLFDEVIIVVASSGSKQGFLKVEQRIELLEKVYQQEARVKVRACAELVAKYAQEHQVSCIVRGLRSAADFEFEQMMARMNEKLFPQLITCLVTTKAEYSFISSTLVREVLQHQGDASLFLSNEVMSYLKQIGKIVE